MHEPQRNGAPRNRDTRRMEKLVDEATDMPRWIYSFLATMADKADPDGRNIFRPLRKMAKVMKFTRKTGRVAVHRLERCARLLGYLTRYPCDCPSGQRQHPQTQKHHWHLHVPPQPGELAALLDRMRTTGRTRAVIAHLTLPTYARARSALERAYGDWARALVEGRVTADGVKTTALATLQFAQALQRTCSSRATVGVARELQQGVARELQQVIPPEVIPPGLTTPGSFARPPITDPATDRGNQPGASQLHATGSAQDALPGARGVPQPQTSDDDRDDVLTGVPLGDDDTDTDGGNV